MTPTDFNVELISRIVEIISTIGAVGVVVYKLGRTVEKFEAIGRQQASELSELKADVKIVGDILTRVALQNQRQDTYEERLNRFERLLDDIRRGEGMVLPLTMNPKYSP